MLRKTNEQNRIPHCISNFPWGLRQKTFFLPYDIICNKVSTKHWHNQQSCLNKVGCPFHRCVSEYGLLLLMHWSQITIMTFLQYQDFVIHEGKNIEYYSACLKSLTCGNDPMLLILRDDAHLSNTVPGPPGSPSNGKTKRVISGFSYAPFSLGHSAGHYYYAAIWNLQNHMAAIGQILYNPIRNVTFALDSYYILVQSTKGGGWPWLGWISQPLHHESCTFPLEHTCPSLSTTMESIRQAEGCKSHKIK